jgi:hypothetical protein
MKIREVVRQVHLGHKVCIFASYVPNVRQTLKLPSHHVRDRKPFVSLRAPVFAQSLKRRDYW